MWEISLVSEGSNGQLHGHVLAYQGSSRHCESTLLSCDDGAPLSPISDTIESSVLLAGRDQMSSDCTLPTGDIEQGCASALGKPETGEYNSSSRKSHGIAISDLELETNVTVKQEYSEPHIRLSTSSDDASCQKISRHSLSENVLAHGGRLSYVGSIFSGTVRSIVSPQELSPPPVMSRSSLSDEQIQHCSFLGDLSECGIVSSYRLGQSDFDMKLPNDVHVLHQRSSHDLVQVSSDLTASYLNTGSLLNQPCNDFQCQVRKPALGQGASFQDVSNKNHADEQVAVGNTSSGPALKLNFAGSQSSQYSLQLSVSQLSPSNQQIGPGRPWPFSQQPSVPHKSMSLSCQQPSIAKPSQSTSQTNVILQSLSIQQPGTAWPPLSSTQLSPSNNQHLNPQHYLLDSQKPEAEPVLVTARLPKCTRVPSSSTCQFEYVSSDVRLPAVALKEGERRARY